MVEHKVRSEGTGGTILNFGIPWRRTPAGRLGPGARPPGGGVRDRMDIVGVASPRRPRLGPRARSCTPAGDPSLPAGAARILLSYQACRAFSQSFALRVPANAQRLPKALHSPSLKSPRKVPHSSRIRCCRSLKYTRRRSTSPSMTLDVDRSRVVMLGIRIGWPSASSLISGGVHRVLATGRPGTRRRKALSEVASEGDRRRIDKFGSSLKNTRG
jgi:hypothetical protein